MNEAKTAVSRAGVGRRLGAMLYDALLLFAVLALATFVASLLWPSAAIGPAPDGDTVTELQPALQGWAYQLYLFSITALFYSWFWQRTGQTLGMQTWRLKLVDASGHPPGFGRALLRFIVAIPCLLPAGLGLFWLWADKDGRSLHDRWSGTDIVLLPKP